MTKQKELQISKQIMNSCFDKAVHHYDVNIANPSFDINNSYYQP